MEPSGGDSFSVWLEFVEARSADANARYVEATAHPLPSWFGAQPGRHPVRREVHGSSLYWDAPAPVSGAVAVRGCVRFTNYAAPIGFPETQGVIRRVESDAGGGVLVGLRLTQPQG